MSTTAGAGSLIIGVLLMVLGVSLWFQKHVRVFAGVAAILLALVSIPVSNLGGFLIGFLFALVVLSTTVIAFPLLLDCDVGAYAAIETSARSVLANPVPMLLWGLIVAVALLIGSIPLLAGLAVVIPVLGHATWHLYRKVVDIPADKRTPLTPSSRNRDGFPYWLRW